MSGRSRIRNAAGALVAGAMMIGAVGLTAAPAQAAPDGVAVTLAGGVLYVTDALANALSVGQTPSATLVALPCPPHTPIIKG